MKAHAAQQPDEPGTPIAPEEVTTSTRLTPEKVARVLQARDAIARGQVFVDATEIIRQAREERTEQLTNREERA
ncbi:MAG TPA: hypothetical protein VHB98_23770 [Chloroflexota bacterium]|jgi:hypothetical protein|nr:hypothetical protein [Chloroflexota bacterium]